MSATVGAALKKILVALLSDPKVIKTIFGIIIGIIIIVVMPDYCCCVSFQRQYGY